MLFTRIYNREHPRAWFAAIVFGLLHLILSVHLVFRFMNAADEPIGSGDWQLIPAVVILFPMWLLGLVGLFTLWDRRFCSR